MKIESLDKINLKVSDSRNLRKKACKNSTKRSGLVWFNDISNIVGYLMPNPIFTSILNIWFVNILLETHS